MMGDAIPAMAGLPVGTVFGQPERGFDLRPERFNRHTFWCGQSGSGKTYALGVVLEQLLLNTELPLLILDPNSDFVRLGEPRAGADQAAAVIAGRDIRVLHTGGKQGEELHARFIDLDAATQGAVLQMDAIRDAEEFSVLLDILGQHSTSRTASSLEVTDRLRSLHSSEDQGEHLLGLRVKNLEVLDWDVWSRGGRSVTDVVDERPAATVMDLGGFTHRPEAVVAAAAVLEHLWKHREERRPVLIVIDEAHNLCPPDPKSLIQRVLTDQIIQIAAEGRKFGLWLFLSTQRPTKIHPNVLSQCDNLGLMRMSSPRDLVELADVFGYAPTALIEQSPTFVQGQALFAGGFVVEPQLVQMGARLTEEGGSDVRVPMRG
jgi:DNA helicase HerA-like ATPase